MRVEREGGSPPMAEDLEEQLRAAREQGQLQAAQSKATLDLCVNVLVRPTRISPRQPVRGRRAA